MTEETLKEAVGLTFLDLFWEFQIWGCSLASNLYKRIQYLSNLFFRFGKIITLLTKLVSFLNLDGRPSRISRTVPNEIQPSSASQANFSRQN